MLIRILQQKQTFIRCSCGQVVQRGNWCKLSCDCQSAVVVPYEQLSAKRVVDEWQVPVWTADQINAACYMPPEDCIKIDGVICAPYDTCQGVLEHSQLQIEDGKLVYVGKATVNAVAGWGGGPEVMRSRGTSIVCSSMADLAESVA